MSTENVPQQQQKMLEMSIHTEALQSILVQTIKKENVK